MDYLPFKDMTDQERNGVTELRRRVENEMPPSLLKDKTVYIRFLRARECNINKATEMLRNHIKWRKLNDTDNIQTLKDPAVMQYYPTTLIGFTKTGLPLRYNDVGKADVKGVLKSIKPEKLIKCVMKIIESDVALLQKQSENLGKIVDKWIYITNFENFSLATATNKRSLQYIMQLVNLHEKNYPETLKAYIIINASAYFTIIYNAVKPLINEITLNKVMVFGKDGWKEELLKLVDADVLPAFLGGNRVDENGDPMCSSFIKHGRPVPESYYFRSVERRLRNQPDISKLVVSRMSKNAVELDVKKVGYFIEWQFETESRDISFGLFMKVAGNSDVPILKKIIPMQRVEAHIECETGTYRCEEPGKYILQFDNSHSWLRNKEVYYRAEVVESCE